MKPLIDFLRFQIVTERLSKQTIKDAIDRLRALGYSTYDDDKFPPLKSGHNYAVHSNRYIDLQEINAPTDLAEAMLWKLGRWTAYKNFVKSYDNPHLFVSSEGGVVMTAFAKHLRNAENPIYDQHAVRSLWAIAPLDKAELISCESLLVDRHGNWKESGSGKSALACYELFLKHTLKIREANGVSFFELDRLMMPLGQALKIATRKTNGKKTDLDNFKAICGYD